MADAPPDDTREKIVSDWCPDINEPGRRTLLAELDRVDPLRVLLADEDRAVEFAARARYDDCRTTEALSLPSWDDATEWSRTAWRNETALALRPVLAALRKVAGV